MTNASCTAMAASEPRPVRGHPGLSVVAALSTCRNAAR
jgi:hypothetical protein